MENDSSIPIVPGVAPLNTLSTDPMQPFKSSSLRSCVALALASLVSVPCGFAQYSTGFSWNAGQDYQPGSVHNSSAGNPNLDAEGNPVWNQLVFHGGDVRESGSPWYDQPFNHMVWDSDYYGFGGHWARADDQSPITNTSYMQHDLHDSVSFGSAPAYRWDNPLTTTQTLRLRGDLQMYFSNWGGGSLPNVGVDIVIFHDDVSTGSRQFLVSTTVTNPGHLGQQIISLGDHSFVVEPGDQLTMSIRARSTLATSQIGCHWNTMLQIVCDAGDTSCACQMTDTGPFGTGDPGPPSTVHSSWNTRVADDFTVTSERVLERIQWWGSAFQVSGGGGCVPSSREFDLRIYQDEAGYPGMQIGPTIHAVGGVNMEHPLTGQQLHLNGDRLYPRRHIVNLGTPIVLPGAGTYWLEVVETMGEGCSWLWQRSSDGDSRSLHDVNMGGYGPEDVNAIDLAWCLSFAEGEDCNNNWIEDTEDISSGGSLDANGNGIPDECDIDQLCWAKQNSQGVSPTIATSGYPTLTGPDNFHITANGVIAGELGVLLWGFQPNPLPGGGWVQRSRLGTRVCVYTPATTGLQIASGTPGQANGTLDFPISQAMMSGNTWLAGQSIYAQWIVHDPLHADGTGLGQTGSVRFEVLP